MRMYVARLKVIGSRTTVYNIRSNKYVKLSN